MRVKVGKYVVLLEGSCSVVGSYFVFVKLKGNYGEPLHISIRDLTNMKGTNKLKGTVDL